MERFGKAVIGAALIGLFVITSGPASADWKADCAAKVKILEERVQDVPGSKKVMIEGLISKALQSIKNNNKDGCDQKTAKAERKLNAWGY